MCCCCWRGVPWDAPAVTGKKARKDDDVAEEERVLNQVDENGHRSHQLRDNQCVLRVAAPVQLVSSD